MQTGNLLEKVLPPCVSTTSQDAVARALSCPTLCDPMDCNLPGSSVHRICQARILEWGAIAFFLYSLWGCKELDMTEQLSLPISPCIHP